MELRTVALFQGERRRDFAQHVWIYFVLACLFPTALLYVWERRSRKEFLTSIR